VRVHGRHCACSGAKEIYVALPLQEDFGEKGLLQKLKLSFAVACGVAGAGGDWGRNTRVLRSLVHASLPWSLPVTVVVALTAKLFMRIWIGETAVPNVFIFPPCVLLTSRQFARKSTAALVAAEPRVA
jgi:hypothetical protein